jgi:hypothetical protein
MDLSKLSQTNQNNLERFWQWADTTGRARVYKFSVPGDKLERLLAADTQQFASATHTGLSDMITNFLSVSPESLHFFKNYSVPSDWNSRHPDLYACYRICKALWLCDDVARNGIQAPMQLIQYGRGYQTHPGSDKKFVITVLEPQPSIPMFYIWYPELDPAPWIWTVAHQEIATPQDFCDMFVNADHPTFQFKYNEVALQETDVECSDTHLMPWAQGAHYACQEYGRIKPGFNVRLPTISYTDAVHRQGMYTDAHRLIDQARQTSEDVFWMGKHRFIKYQGIWILDRFLNLPSSLVDADWQWRPDRAVYFDNCRPNISQHRTGM